MTSPQDAQSDINDSFGRKHLNIARPSITPSLAGAMGETGYTADSGAICGVHDAPTAMRLNYLPRMMASFYRHSRRKTQRPEPRYALESVRPRSSIVSRVAAAAWRCLGWPACLLGEAMSTAIMSYIMLSCKLPQAAALFLR